MPKKKRKKKKPEKSGRSKKGKGEEAGGGGGGEGENTEAGKTDGKADGKGEGKKAPKKEGTAAIPKDEVKEGERKPKEGGNKGPRPPRKEFEGAGDQTRQPRPPREPRQPREGEAEGEAGYQQRERPRPKYPPKEVFAPTSGSYEPAALDDVLGAITHHFATKTK